MTYSGVTCLFTRGLPSRLFLFPALPTTQSGASLWARSSRVLEKTINRLEQLKSPDSPAAHWTGTNLIAGQEIEQSLGQQLGSGTYRAFLLWIVNWV